MVDDTMPKIFPDYDVEFAVDYKILKPPKFTCYNPISHIKATRIRIFNANFARVRHDSLPHSRLDSPKSALEFTRLIMVLRN